MKKILILTYYWPPFASSGVQRWLKFVKYLPQHQWHPIVITPKNATAPNYDPGLLSEIPANAQIIKTPTREVFKLYNILQKKKPDSTIQQGMIGIKDSKSLFQRLSMFVRGNFFVPDGRVGWVNFATKAALQTIKAENPDVLVTTGPPHSTHLAGLKIKQATGIYWIADLRDPWTNIYYNKSLPRMNFAKRKDQKLENKVLQTADAITVTAQGLKQEFANRNKNIKVIYNGYDKTEIPPVPNTVQNKFSLWHVGNFFPYLDAPGLWKALDNVCANNPEFKKHFNLNFTGNIDPNIWQKIKKMPHLSNCANNLGYVNHHTALEHMVSASVLLFVIYNDPSSQTVIQAKLFEYFAASRPILAIGNHNSEAGRVVKQFRNLPLFDYNGSLEIEKFVLEQFALWQSNQQKAIRLPDDTIKEFERQQLTAQLVTLLNK